MEKGAQDTTRTSTAVSSPSMTAVVLCFLFLLASLSLNVYIFGDDILSGAGQMTLMLVSFVFAGFAIHNGTSWALLLAGIKKSVSTAMEPLLILLLIGALSGSWLISGIIPTVVYYGLKILNPHVFLVTSCLIASIVSLCTGSSWATIATFGMAFLGVGKVMGFHEGLIAGAIISGAYFGDKMSPMSDTTNLAAAVTNTKLFTHIKHMAGTTAPAWLLTLAIYAIWGFWDGGDEKNIAGLKDMYLDLSDTFTVSAWLLLIPLVVVILIAKKVPAIAALSVGIGLGCLVTPFTQSSLIQAMGYQQDITGVYTFLARALYGDVTISMQDTTFGNLLSSGGMRGMLDTLWLILCAMILGGIMEAGGFLQTITKRIFGQAKKERTLIFSAMGTCIFFNATASDQYLSIMVPGRLFAPLFMKKNVPSEQLSRTLEDAATVTSVLVPWNTCGATQASVLGVSTLVYAPYCFFNIMSPLMTMLFAVLKKEETGKKR